MALPAWLKMMPKKRLRSGFTTGTAAAAAAKAALRAIVQARDPRSVRIDFLSPGRVDIPVHRLERLSTYAALATVIKDAGDDPDVTHGAEIGARVTITPSAARSKKPPRVVIRGGPGVGRITKPGLEMPPGEPAINPGPRRMIQQAVRQALNQQVQPSKVEVVVFVPDGERLARKTLNARLGIVGGLSILGTTGIVKPMSHAAYTATIRSALSVARASAGGRVVMTTGRRSERYAQQFFQDWKDEQFVQIGDYFQFALSTAAEMAFHEVVVAVFFAKAVKMALGVPHTHAARSTLLLDRLADWTAELTGKGRLAAAVREANTARHAFDLLGAENPQVLARVGQGIVRHAQDFADRRLPVRSLIFDYQGGIVFDSAK
jgi:cobalt-precorrin-5B (C1)-methyltransferase